MADARQGNAEGAAKTKKVARMDAHGPKLSLVFHVGGEVLVRALPERGVLDIGRDAECAIVIESAAMSRRHARLEIDDGALAIEDLASTNGTRVRGRALEPGERRELAMGDVIELGEDVVAFVRGGSVEASALVRAPARAKDGEGAAAARPAIVRDARMLELYRLLGVVAPSPFCVLILGETGVGKDVFAEWIHQRSPRAKGPFVRINCAALGETLLQSELFGHEKGAFTGAVASKPGLFEAADGGTLLLDEVGDLPAATQAMLLRVLESGEVTRLGSVRPRRVDVRFVAATNRDLHDAVERQTFRADLFFRLSGVVVTIPPLRERPDDVLPLAEHFVGEAAKRLQRRPPELSASAAAKLRAHAWPGNIRELKNVLERALLLAPAGPIDAEQIDLAAARGPASHAPPRIADPPMPAAGSMDAEGSFRDRVKSLERARILEALEKCGGNQSRAAKMLGIPRRTFVKRLDEYGVTRPRKE